MSTTGSSSGTPGLHKQLREILSDGSTMTPNELARLEALAAQTQQRHEKLKKTVSDLHESLDYLRLSIKYLIFDLEATRRENAQLRQMLENRPPN